ncbi:MAG: D-alanyl-D-alanine carboxypeptidase/D-alanyl-D-alanine-endopeptidase [Saprospiraceae bacterium]|nr:D-alanyl-D-alanine carboxypeptidase/D-alanyl-D-alanine-endopeptidase [Saprospiraceae bacterium]
MMYKGYWLFIVIGLGWSNIGCSQSSKQGKAYSMEDFESDSCFQSAGVSLAILDILNDSILVALKPSHALPPASTQKILVTALALKVMGADFQFQTRIGHTGTIRHDTLFGNLIIRGFGDPSLGSAHFPETAWNDVMEALVKFVSDKGIRHIAGTIIGDASFYGLDAIAQTWPYQDLANYYGAFCTGLNFHDNKHSLHFKQNLTPGAEVNQLEIAPEVPGLSIRSLVKTGPRGSGDEAYIMGAPLQTNRYVRGTIPPGSGTFTIEGSLPDPPYFLAYHLKKNLAARGISSGEIQANYENTLDVVEWFGTLNSPALRRIVNLTNQNSINLFAEALGMRAQDSLAVKNGDWMIDFWAEKKVDMRGCHFEDYSGLSPFNALSAQAMVQILRIIHEDQTIWPDFLESLAVAGQSGTLRSFLKSTKAEGRVFAKSGLISGVRSYAGYMVSESGKWYAFDIMTHNSACGAQQVRKKLEQLLETLYLSLP